MKDNTDKKKIVVSFSAIDPYVESNIIKPTIKVVRGQSYLEFGERNNYPNYIHNLYSSAPTLGSIINSIVDYGSGDEVKTKDVVFFRTDKDARDFVRKALYDLAIYGGCYLNVLRNKLGQVCKLEVLDYRNVRTDEDNDWFWYSKDFKSDKTYGRIKTHAYEAFDKESVAPSSVYYIKINDRQPYSLPMWQQAVIPSEIEKATNEFSLNEINNGLMSNVIITLLNGIPTDEMKEEIEEAIEEKFSGFQNSGRPLLFFGNDKEHGLQVDKIDSDNFADKYEKLTERCKQQIFTAFRCNANLCGVPTASGFSNEEYQSSYQLFYKTVVLPLQRSLTDALEDIAGKDLVEIIPFALDFGEKREIKDEVV